MKKRELYRNQIDLVVIFLLQIVFDISVWFHFAIALMLLPPLPQDMQIWVFLTHFSNNDFRT